MKFLLKIALKMMRINLIIFRAKYYAQNINEILNYILITAISDVNLTQIWWRVFNIYIKPDAKFL